MPTVGVHLLDAPLPWHGAILEYLGARRTFHVHQGIPSSIVLPRRGGKIVSPPGISILGRALIRAPSAMAIKSMMTTTPTQIIGERAYRRGYALVFRVTAAVRSLPSAPTWDRALPVPI
jgi:hypothetical protein